MSANLAEPKMELSLFVLYFGHLIFGLVSTNFIKSGEIRISDLFSRYYLDFHHKTRSIPYQLD
jgi:hypothetical protein